MGSNAKAIASELLPILKVYKDGTVERLVGSPFVPPSREDPSTGVSSKDTVISPLVSARFLPKLSPPTNQQKLPILVYFHGGGFCIESAFSSLYQNSMNSLVSQAKVIAISVEYMLAPEHPLPAAYEDSWTALKWVASHSLEDNNINKDPWLIKNGDFDRVNIGGDSVGANIAHNLTIRAGAEGLFGGVKILDAFLAHPYFWGSDTIGSESISAHEEHILHRIWAFLYHAPVGMDHPLINPLARDAPSLSVIGCSRLLVCVAEMDCRALTFCR